MKAIVLLSVFICGFYAITAQQSSTQSVPASSSAIPAPPNRTEGSNGAWVRVLGRSGRIIIGRNADPDTDSNGIVLGFESLTEVDAQGNAIMISDHYLTNFGRTDFRFGSTREYMFQGLNTRHFDFAARVQMTYDAMLLIKVYIFRDSGNVTMDNETIPVGRGDIKFSVDIQNWRFCGAAGVRACVSGSQNLIGDGLDLVMSIRGQRSEGPRERNEDERRARRIRGGRDFDLGGRNSIVLSTKVSSLIMHCVFRGQHWITAKTPQVLSLFYIYFVASLRNSFPTNRWMFVSSAC